MARVQTGDVLVADMTDPDWEPVMKRAAAIVTNRGGRTCHAAIIARELGIPAVVGCGDATQRVREGQEVTVSCAEGDTGYVYEGLLEFERKQIELDSLPEDRREDHDECRQPRPRVRLRQHSASRRGPGTARIHHQPDDRRASARAARVRPPGRGAAGPDPDTDGRLRAIRWSFYVDKLAEGISQIAAAFAPEPVIVRLSDFKSNEYANLIGGSLYEPDEENPMLGFRGASRYVDETFRPCFELECRALKKVREAMGLTNVQVMVPFVRTVKEAKQVTELLAQNGLKSGVNDLKIIMMCELPTNALLADEYLNHFDGMSIGSNDMTQLTLGLDRDSSIVAKAFDERDEAVKILLSMAISACKRRKKYVGICGQGPSDHPELARWLQEQGIESMSLNPDTVVETWMFLATAEEASEERAARGCRLRALGPLAPTSAPRGTGRGPWPPRSPDRCHRTAALRRARWSPARGSAR